MRRLWQWGAATGVVAALLLAALLNAVMVKTTFLPSSSAARALHRAESPATAPATTPPPVQLGGPEPARPATKPSSGRPESPGSNGLLTATVASGGRAPSATPPSATPDIRMPILLGLSALALTAGSVALRRRATSPGAGTISEERDW